MLDPNFSTPIARELAFFNIAILVAAFHVLTIMAPILPSFSFATIFGVYGLTLIVGCGLAVVLGKRVPATGVA